MNDMKEKDGLRSLRVHSHFYSETVAQECYKRVSIYPEFSSFLLKEELLYCAAAAAIQYCSSSASVGKLNSNQKHQHCMCFYLDVANLLPSCTSKNKSEKHLNSISRVDPNLQV